MSIVLSADCGVKLLSYLHELPIMYAEADTMLATRKTTSPLLIPSLATLISGNLVSCWSGLYTAVSNIKETLLDPPPHSTREKYFISVSPFLSISISLSQSTLDSFTPLSRKHGRNHHQRCRPATCQGQSRPYDRYAIKTTPSTISLLTCT
jgi:hypothetical protein